MKTLGLVATLLTYLLGAAAPALAQDTPTSTAPEIEAVEVSGLELDRLSVGLREDIEALVSTRLNRDRLSTLAGRIESEHPDVVAAFRDVPRPDARVRVIFLVARISEDETLVSNINARYVIERVEISGIDEMKISQGLLDELQRLVGGRFDSAVADALADRLEAEQADYEVGRRLSKGSDPGALKVVFTFRRPESRRWIHFPPSRSKLVYQQDLGWSGVWDIGIGGAGNGQFSVGLVRGNNDDLVEEYSGYWFRFESREAATRRLGLRLELSKFTPKWRDETMGALDADLFLPRAYNRRVTVEPAVTFAISRQLRVTGGVSASELRPLDPSADAQHANTGFLTVGYDQTWRPGYSSDRHPDAPVRHKLEAAYQLRSGLAALDSDLSYRRHLGEVRYRYEQRRNAITALFSAGSITGAAPIFERFTLGDTAMLRGWNKYVVAPAGGTRMLYQSLEYRYRGFAYFVDAGSIWSPDNERKLRLSTGVGFHGDNAFLTFGVPLNGDDMGGKFSLGIRF